MRRGTLGVFSLSVVLPSSTQTLLIPALPALSDERGFSPVANGWLLSAFLLGASISAPLMGRLGDMKGRRRLIVLVSATHVVGASLCLAGGEHAFLVALGRGCQGFSAGVFVLQIATIQELASPASRATLIGVLSGVVAMGPAIGFLVGGLVTAHLGVSMLFVIGIVAGVISTTLLWFCTPDSGGTAPGKVDVTGAALVALSLFLVVATLAEVGVSGWAGRATLLLLVAAMALSASTGWWMRRAAVPFIDLHALRNRMGGLTCVATFLSAAVMFGLFVVVPQLVQDETAGFGLGAVAAGLVLAPGAVAMALAGPLCGRLGGPRGLVLAIVGGNAVAGVALAGLGVLPRSVPVVILVATVAAIGIGIAFPALPAVAMSAAPPEGVGAAAGINSLMRGMGSAAGAQVALVLAASRPDGAGGYDAAFLLSALAAGLAAVVAVAMGRPQRLT